MTSTEAIARVAECQAAIDGLHGKTVTVNLDGGAGMFARFTDRARRVVVLAQEQARELNHSHIGTGHFLLGLIREGDSVGAQTLKASGIDLDECRQQVEKLVVQADERSPSGHIPFTSRGKKVLELALREALQLGHNYIGTEHILLALIREGEGVGAQVLTSMGVELNAVRLRVLEILAAAPSQRPAVPSPDATLLKSLRVYVDAINAQLKTAGY